MLLVLLSVVWGGSFFFNGIALREFPTLSIVTARVGLAALALLFLSRMLGHDIELNRQILKAFFGMSFLNNVVPFSMIVWGQQHIASGVASILNASTASLPCSQPIGSPRMKKSIRAACSGC